MLIFSSPCRRPLRLLRYELFTNCKKFLETIMLASKWTRLFGSFYRKQEQRNIWKGFPVFPDRMVQAELHEKPSLIPVSGFRGRFSINGPDLYTMVNAIPGEIYQFWIVNRPVLPMQMVNNHDFALWEGWKAIPWVQSVSDTEKIAEWKHSCRRLQLHFDLGSFGVVLMSFKLNFHVVRSSALQNYEYVYTVSTLTRDMECDPFPTYSYGSQVTQFVWS